MIYLYGLLDGIDPGDAAAVTAGLSGLTGRVLTAPCGPWHLAYGPHDGQEVVPRRRLMIAHAKVSEALMPLGTLLPMRFGMVSPGLTAFADIAKRHEAEILSAVERLRGHAELGVRVEADENAALAATLEGDPRLARLRDRLQGAGSASHFDKVELGRQIGDALAERRGKAQKRLLAAMKPLCRAFNLSAPGTDLELLRAEFLVPRDAVAAFSAALDAATRALDFTPGTEVTIRIVGPGPAFHFTGLSLSSAETETEVA